MSTRVEVRGAQPAGRGVSTAASREARGRTARDADYIVRFDLHQRAQHVLMMTSFIVLAVTGLPQKFDSLAISQWAIALFGGLDMTRAIHHYAAYVMLFDCLYHAAFLVVRIGVQRRPDSLGMIPTLQDFKDVGQTILYFVGLAPRKPEFERFAYIEKFDYWAVFWGIVIIGGSGLILMFPVIATSFLPGYMVPVAFAAHTEESILAVGWILIVHMFYAHLAPSVFPFNLSIFTGKVHKDLARREHGRWYRRMTEATATAIPVEAEAVVVPPAEPGPIAAPAEAGPVAEVPAAVASEAMST